MGWREGWLDNDLTNLNNPEGLFARFFTWISSRVTDRKRTNQFALTLLSETLHSSTCAAFKWAEISWCWDQADAVSQAAIGSEIWDMIRSKKMYFTWGQFVFICVVLQHVVPSFIFGWSCSVFILCHSALLSSKTIIVYTAELADMFL